MAAQKLPTPPNPTGSFQLPDIAHTLVDMVEVASEDSLAKLLEQMNQHVAANELRAAVGLLETADAQLKETATWLNARGLVAFRFGEFGASLDYFQRALDKNGPTAEILSNLGAVHLERAKGSAGAQQREAYQQALEYLNKALFLEAGNPNILTNLALAYNLAGDMSRCELYLDRTLARDPRHPAALFQKAQLLYERGSLADSLKLIDTILEDDPDQPEATAQRNLILDRLSF